MKSVKPERLGPELYPATYVVHGSYEPSNWAGSVSPPVVLSSTYERTGSVCGDLSEGYEYSRVTNPNREWLERDIAQLEGGQAAFAFSSGCAAIAAALQALPKSTTFFADEHIYGGTYRILSEFSPSWGHKPRWINLEENKGAELEDAKEGDLLWFETPCNPSLKIWDLERTIAKAKSRGMLVCVDNTFATPLLQKPFEYGADIVVHSTSKYINGHSDVVGGLVVLNHKELGERLRSIQMGMGAVPSPFDCYMTLRGLKTMAIRMERHCENAHSLAEHIASTVPTLLSSSACRVVYPGMSSHPNHGIAKKQMKSFGGVISLIFEKGAAAAEAFLGQLKLFRVAGSLGGVESLACHPRSSSHMSVPKERCERTGISDGMVRLSVGIEDVRDLYKDVESGLKALS